MTDANHRPSTVHVIRLRDPWESEFVTNAKTFAVRFQRGFGLPTGLGPQDEIHVVIEGTTASGRVWLNQTLLGEISVDNRLARFSVTGQLQNRNRLLIEFVFPTDEAGSEHSFSDYLSEVRLEIQSH